MNGPAARKWSVCMSPAGLILAVVVLVQSILFIGYHRERWIKGIVPLQNPQALTGEGFIIRCDGHGYYAWLRSLLVDGDLSFDNEFDEHNPLGDWVPPRTSRTENGLRSNHWSVGPACVWSLVLVPAHSLIFGLQELGFDVSPNGYSMAYQLLLGITTLLFSLLGLFFLHGICRHYAEPKRAALASAFLFLGTNIVFYSSIEVCMAHGLGATAVAGLTWYWLTTYGSRRPRRWFIIGMLVGLSGLMRWQLATLTLLPLAESCLLWRRLSRDPGRCFGKTLGNVVLAGIGAIVAFAPQLFAWQALYGSWLVSPLTTGHNWLHPSWNEVLWSTDRSLFYWTPMTILALSGLVVYLTRRRTPVVDSSPALSESSHTDSSSETLLILLAAFGLQVYVLASIWGEAIQLGVSFGFRHLTESVVLLAPGLALLLQRLDRRGYLALASLGCILVLWNLLLISQYRYGLVPAADGVDVNELLTNAARLLARKKSLLVGQVLIGPLLLWLLAIRCPTPIAQHDSNPRASRRRSDVEIGVHVGITPRRSP